MAITVAFLGLFLYRVDFSQMAAALARANYIYLAPAVLVYFVGVWFRALRWRFLLLSLGRITPQRLFPPIVMGFAINNIIPARLGLVARAYLVGEREGISKIASGATVVVDQLFDGIALLLFLEVIALFVPLVGWAKAMAWLAALVFGGFFAIFFFLAYSPPTAHRLVGAVTRFLPPTLHMRIDQWLDLALSGLTSLHHPARLVVVFFLSLLVWLTEAAMYYLVSFSFGMGQPFYVILLVCSIANIAITLPSLPGGIGPFEFFGKQTLLLFGVGEAVATAYVAVLHVTLLLPVTLVGLGFLGWSNVKMAEIIGQGKKKG